MITAIEIIAERRISEAIQEGRLAAPNWHGKPLPQEDNHFVPANLRMAYKILKNAGYLPPEIETRKEIHNLEQLIAKTDDEHVRLKQLKKLNLLIMKLDTMRSHTATIDEQEVYYRKITEKLSVQR
jgi:hypothetical protein